MTETVQIALIVAAAVVVALLAIVMLLRKRLHKANFEMSDKGVSAGFSTEGRAVSPPRAGVSISGNTQKGQHNAIEVEQSDVEIQNNRQDGDNHRIQVKTKS